MKTFERLYIANLINTFGSWLTFLAIALITQERYGTQYVALVFLVQTLPAIVFSRGLARSVAPGRHEQVFAVCQILLALNSAVLIFNQDLPVIFAHLFVASILRSLSGPIFNSLTGKWVPKERQQEVFTRLGALQAGTLAFAPMAGAWLKIMTSASLLFAVDAATFIIGLLLLKELVVTPTGERWINLKWRQWLAEISPRPGNLSAETNRALITWFVFLTVGALLNAIEFPGFELHRLSEQQIGYALAAWGSGSLVAFVFPLQLRHAYSSALYVMALAIFVWAGGPLGVIVAFLLAGIFYSYFSGSLRAQLQASVPGTDNAAPMWAYANQITQMINLVAYASAGLLLTTLGFYLFGYFMLVTGLILIALCWRLHPHKA